MSVTSSRNVQAQFSGDIDASFIVSALDNIDSPGISDVKTLSAGANTITAPVIAGIVVTGVTIIPPAGNTVLLTLKGVAGDTGIPIHITDPTSLALDLTFVSLVINAVTAVAGLRLIWT